MTTYLKNIAVTVTGCLLMSCLVCCKKEGAVSADIQPPLYQLPQGNHAYDQEIVQIREKYGSYFLYKFDSADYSYNLTNYLPVSAKQGNEAYIQESLNFIKTQCLDNYSDSFKLHTMPLKVILASTIDSVIVDTRVAGGQRNLAPSVSRYCAGVNTLIFGWADSMMVQQTATQRKFMRGFLNRAYFERALAGGSLIIPEAFSDLQPSAGYSNIPPSGYQYQYGWIELRSGGAISLTLDFLCYINAITSNSRAELEATILKPSNDTKGLIRKKYNALIDYYKDTYGIDLQAIGELP